MIKFCDKWSLLYLKTGGMVPYTYRRFMHFLYREDSPKPKYTVLCLVWNIFYRREPILVDFVGLPIQILKKPMNYNFVFFCLGGQH